MKIFTQKKMSILVIILLCSLCVNLVYAVSGSTPPEPGSDQDPVVSKSYVDAGIGAQNEVIKKLSAEVEALKQQKTSGSGGFETISVKNGQTMLTGSGTEVVLRSGKAYAVKGTGGGLADTTSAKDLVNGMALSANHLLISARDDGRGIKASSDCWFLIRGSYSLNDAAAGTPEDNPAPKPDNTKTMGIVNANGLNVRAQPDTNAVIYTKLNKGDKVEILAKKDSWYQVVTPRGVTGWVSADFVDVSQ